MFRRVIRKMICYTHIGQIRLGIKKIILIHAHMRSGSSLLLNLLNNSPETLGRGELSRAYRDMMDFTELIRLVNGSYDKIWGAEKYIVDKIVEPNMVYESVINSNFIYNIFLIRNPESTLPSLVKFPTLVNEPPMKIDDACVQYVERLYSITELARKAVKDRSLFVTYDQMVSHTDRVFGKLEGILELENKLKENYTSTKSKSKVYKGDPSGNTESGRILRNKNDRYDVPIPEHIMKKTNAAYCETKTELKKWCQNI